MNFQIDLKTALNFIKVTSLPKLKFILAIVVPCIIAVVLTWYWYRIPRRLVEDFHNDVKKGFYEKAFDYCSVKCKKNRFRSKDDFINRVSFANFDNIKIEADGTFEYSDILSENREFIVSYSKKEVINKKYIESQSQRAILLRAISYNGYIQAYQSDRGFLYSEYKLKFNVVKFDFEKDNVTKWQIASIDTISITLNYQNK